MLSPLTRKMDFTKGTNPYSLLIFQVINWLKNKTVEILILISSPIYNSLTKELFFYLFFQKRGPEWSDRQRNKAVG